MMSVPAEGAERLVEIFREMLALSETSRSNHSQSAVTDASIELSDTHGVTELRQAAPCGKQASEKPRNPEDQDSPC